MKRALLAGLLLVLASFPASAHHSTTAEFDVTHRMTLAGTLTKVDWVNPHIVVFMTAKDGAWKFESNPPAWFRRVGVSRADFSKAIGQAVTVEGNRAKDGSQYRISRQDHLRGRQLARARAPRRGRTIAGGER